MLIAGARLEGTSDLAVMIGWNGEAFARTKTIKPLAEYLKPPLSPEEKRRQGARKVRAMFERIAKKQHNRRPPSHSET